MEGRHPRLASKHGARQAFSRHLFFFVARAGVLPYASHIVSWGTFVMRIRAVLALFLLFTCSTHAREPMTPDAILVDDGDTIRVAGKTYRLVGFDAPEIDRAKCAGERELGDHAKGRLQEIIGMGALDLAEVECSCSPGTHGTRFCNFGRLCGALKARGEDVGTTLIREGLARPFHCGKNRCPKRLGWC